MNDFQKKKNAFVHRMFVRNALGIVSKPCPICGKKKQKDIHEVLEKVKKEFPSEKSD